MSLNTEPKINILGQSLSWGIVIKLAMWHHLRWINWFFNTNDACNTLNFDKILIFCTSWAVKKDHHGTIIWSLTWQKRRHHGVELWIWRFLQKICDQRSRQERRSKRQNEIQIQEWITFVNQRLNWLQTWQNQLLWWTQERN